MASRWSQVFAVGDGDCRLRSLGERKHFVIATGTEAIRTECRAAAAARPFHGTKAKPGENADAHSACG
jgi:hypothetical protein